MPSSPLPKRQLGPNGPFVSAIGLGTMGIGAFYGKTDDAAAYEALTYAADCGMTFWDCADIYGTTERTLGEWFTKTGRRKEIFLATKFGGYDPEGKYGGGKGPVSAPSYVTSAVLRSLRELKTDYIDLYYQHRVDPSVPIEAVLEALRPFVESGQIKWLGLSEASVDTLKRAKAVKGMGEKVVAVQMEFSPFELGIEKDGFVTEAENLGVSIVAYSPLGRGMVSGRYRSRADFDSDDFRLKMPRFFEENFDKNVVLADKLKAIADKYHNIGATPSNLSLAWILAEHPKFVPIPGCRSKERVEENAQGAIIAQHLTPEDVKEIREVVKAADVHGERYPPSFMATCEGNCVPLSEWKGE